MKTSSLKETAVRLLARREHSRHELQQKLLARSFEENDIDDTLKELTKKGFQSDQRFTEMYIASRANRGFGPIKIKLELSQRGISDDIIQNALEQSDINWQEIINHIRIKRFGKQKPVNFTEKAKQMRFLAGRGFETEQINSEIYTARR